MNVERRNVYGKLPAAYFPSPLARIPFSISALLLARADLSLPSPSLALSLPLRAFRLPLSAAPLVSYLDYVCQPSRLLCFSPCPWSSLAVPIARFAFVSTSCVVTAQMRGRNSKRNTNLKILEITETQTLGQDQNSNFSLDQIQLF